MAQVSNTRLHLDSVQGVPISPARAAGDDELWHPRPPADHDRQRARPAPQPTVCGQQTRVVLARLDRADGEDEPRLDPLWQLARGGRRAQAFRHDAHAALEAGQRVAGQEVATRGFGRNEHRARALQRRRQDGAEVGALLPRHLGRAQPECQVVDVDRRRWRLRPPPGWARPVRIKDGVAAHLRLDRRQPAGLEDDLVPVGREYGVTVEVGQGGRPLPAAEEGELVAIAAGHEGFGELDRDREHADPLRSPARGDVDCEAGHQPTLSVGAFRGLCLTRHLSIVKSW